MLFAKFAPTFAANIFFASLCQAQESVILPSVQDNQTVKNEQQSPSDLINEKYDWWPPIVPAPLDQEVTQPNVQRYSPWMQPPIPANYYLPASSSAGPIGQVRSEHHAYPLEYAEYPHSSSIVSPGSSNSLGIGSKHLAIVSFIGLLLLFSIIQNSLMSAKRKDALVEALTGRKKRDVFDARGFTAMTPEQEEILNDDARLQCIQRTVCLENRRIMENLGAAGNELAKYLTNDVKRSMKVSSGWGRLVEDAGQAGLKGENCNVLYRDCTMTPEISRSRRNIDDEKKKKTNEKPKVFKK